MKISNKKAFTLIELLAVIVILAIIALITTPIILNMINNARKSAAIDSAYGYIESIETHNAMNAISSDSYSKIEDGVDLDLSHFQNVKIKGTKPSSVKITLTNGVVTYGELTINGFKVIYDGTTANVFTTPQPQNLSTINFTPGTALYYNPVTGKTCFANDEGCMLFYALENSPTSKRTVDLILDHSTTKNIIWANSRDYSNAGGTGYYGAYGRNDKGPVTVLKQLKEDTKNWVGVPLRTDSYTADNGTVNYTIDYTGYRARLITVDEIADMTGASKSPYNWSSLTVKYKGLTYSDHVFFFDTNTRYRDTTLSATKKSNYAWLFDNMHGCEQAGCNVEDNTAGAYYWTSTPLLGSTSDVWVVQCSGSVDRTNVSGGQDLRPVITINK